jgi:MFS family permease
LSAKKTNSPFAAFQHRSYRFQWPSDLLASWAFEMEALILGWYIMVETRSVLLLTLLASLQYVGTLVAPVFGLIGDRVGHRDLLAAMRFTYTALSAAIMVLAFTGQLSPYRILLMVGVMGLIRPSDLGVRGALLADIIPSKELIGAISLSRTTQDSARVAGALTGPGLFATIGIAHTYIVIASIYAAAALLILCVRRQPKAHDVDAPASARGSSMVRELKEGVVYAWSGPGMRAALCVAFLANLAAFPLTSGLLPYIAQDVFLTDQAGLGYLSASFAVGSLIGSTTVSLASGLLIGRLLVGATFAWYAILLVFVEVKALPFGMICLVAAGIAQSMSMISAAVILMRTASPQMRGRVMGVRMMVIYGLPLGLLAAGSLIETIGYPATGSLYALLGMLGITAIALYWRSDLWPIRALANHR